MATFIYNSIGERFSKEYRIYFMAFIIAILSELIGEHKIPLGPGMIVLVPIIYGIIMGISLGPDLLKFFSSNESKAASSLVLVAIAPFMVSLGVRAGANIDQLISFGPALLLQELGNLATIFITLPIALKFGLKREAVGATHSINREANLALIANKYGSTSSEMRGTMSIYIVGGLIGTIYFGFLATVVGSTGLFHPLALGMASGAGSGIMMASASSSLVQMFPEYTDQILMLAGTSDTLTGITGIYVALFLALPITNKLYSVLEPIIGKTKSKND